MVVTIGSVDPLGTAKSPAYPGGAMSPEVPSEHTDTQASTFNFDPAETVIVVRRKKEPGGKENGVKLKSLLNNSKTRSLLANHHICNAPRETSITIDVNVSSSNTSRISPNSTLPTSILPSSTSHTSILPSRTLQSSVLHTTSEQYTEQYNDLLSSFEESSTLCSNTRQSSDYSIQRSEDSAFHGVKGGRIEKIKIVKR